MKETSGAQWCARFPTSAELRALHPDFMRKCSAFIEALRAGGATVHIAATYRPPERAYLMHWACMIGGSGQDPAVVPPMAGVDIDWTHGGDHLTAKAAAKTMMQGYGIAFPAALVSRHTQRHAIDMTIHWTGTIHVTDARGIAHACVVQSDLWAIGASYGVKKLASDPPHWSDDGH